MFECVHSCSTQLNLATTAVNLAILNLDGLMKTKMSRMTCL
jgi:hypothetical protein